MSVKIMAAIWELALPRDEKFVALAVADHANDEGLCFPSVARISWKCGYSRRQVQTILKKLRYRAVLHIEANEFGGRGYARTYRVRPEMGEKSAPFVKGRISTVVRVKPDTSNRALTIAPQPSTTSMTRLRESSRSHRAVSRMACVKTDDSFKEYLVQLEKDFPCEDACLIAWAMERIARRAKTPPLTLAFYRKSFRRLVENLSAERDLFLTEQAKAMLCDGLPSGDIAENLKSAAARHGLPYDSTATNAAIESAERQLRRERETQTALRIGGQPEQRR